MSQYLIAIDQGTTGTTAILVNSTTYQFIDKINQEFPQIFPKPGWVEHNLNDIWGTVKSTISTLLDKNQVRVDEIGCIGITNQRETTCAFDNDGKPLHNAIVWQDRRTTEYCRSFEAKAKTIKQKTGLPLDPYFSGSKIHWLLKNSSEVQQAAKLKNLKFGTIDTFLLYKLTGNEAHKTEATNASRTLLMNLATTQWDPELLDLFEIPAETLPAIQDSFGLFGITKGLDFLPDGIPITGILGDQQAALFGQAGLEKGGIKCTYGTGSFLLLNTGPDIQYSDAGLITTVAYKYAGQNHYALEGSCFIAGAAVQWLRDQLGIITTSPEVEKLANQVTDLEQMQHLLFLPFFAGIGSPYWKPEAKACVLGMSRDTSKAHISKACLDGIALSINDLILAMQKDSDIDIQQLNVDGGAVANQLLMQTQADVSKVKIVRPQIIETTGYGAVLAAAIGHGQLTLSDVKKYWKKDTEFEPDSKKVHFYEDKKMQWEKAIKALFL